ncbi:MAG TPA: serine hydrolase [Thermomicrobiales bacterium]|nr:serine hydrolase [Thermomicrobiales bacterium]
MQVPTATTRDERGYGIGWMCHEMDGVTIVGHTGSMGGVQTILRLVPEEKIAIALRINSSRPMTPPQNKLVEDILAVMLPDHARALAQRRAKPEDEPETPVSEPPADLIGEWRVALHTWQREDQVTLWCDASGQVRMQVGDQLQTLVNDPTFDDGWLTGRMLGDINLPDVSRRRHDLCLDLRLRGDVLSGAIIAQVPPVALGAPRGRVGNALSQWAELRKGS